MLKYFSTLICYLKNFKDNKFIQLKFQTYLVCYGWFEENTVRKCATVSEDFRIAEDSVLTVTGRFVGDDDGIAFHLNLRGNVVFIHGIEWSRCFRAEVSGKRDAIDAYE